MSNPDSDFEPSIPSSPVFTVEMESFQSTKCIDVDLFSLSCKLASQLSVDAVGQCLGLQEFQIQDALKRATERHQDHNKVHLLLIKWREVNGDRATWGALIEQSQSNPEIADIIKNELKKVLPQVGASFRESGNPLCQETVTGMSSGVQEVGASFRESSNPLCQETVTGMPSGVQEVGASFRESSNPLCQETVTGMSSGVQEVGTTFRESSNSLYQELVTGMSSGVQDLHSLNEPAKLELSENVREYEKKFAGLLCIAYGALKRVGVTDSEVRIFLNQMSVSQKENIPLYEERMAGIISNISLEEIFLFCSRIGVWDFLNFQLLQDVANYFGVETLQASLQEYTIAINDFKRDTKLVDFLGVWAGRNTLDTLPDSKPVFAKIKAIKWEEYTLADVARHERYLTGEFRFNQLVFRFSNAGKGSVVLMWLVTKSVASAMDRMMHGSEKPAFDSMTFQELNIGGRTFKITADYDSIYQHSISKPEVFWADRAKEYLHWEQPFDTVMEGDPPGIRWFKRGKINASVNCLDCHVAKDPSTVAIVWEKNEPGEQEEVSYKDLLEKTCQLANVLRSAGVKKGDKVMIYMPVIPLVVAAMLACARMGAVHCVLVSTLGTKDLTERIADTKPKVIITADERVHGRETHALKDNVDEALKKSGHEVDQIFVASRTGRQIPMTPGRDLSLEKEMKKQPTEFDPVPMDSEEDLFIAYTSGTSGKPRRIVHTQAGYLLYAAFTHKFIFDFQPGDVFGCLVDLGWVAGHTSIVYGPLCNGATTVLFEGAPTYPNCERYWEMVDRLKLTHLYTIPADIKLLMEAGDGHVDKFSLSSLRVLALVGEPITSGIEEWCYNVVGRKKCLLLDTWWQTEIGSIAITRWFAPEGQKPSHFPAKSSFPFFGVEPCLVEEKPTLTSEGEVQGCLLLKRPLPGMGRKANDTCSEFKQLYYQHPKAEGYFYTYDLAKCDNKGNYQITGRVHDAPQNESDHHIQETLLVDYECMESTRPPRGYFRGVEVVGELDLVITNEAESFPWEGYGFNLNVPDNALPEGISEYQVNIKTSLMGQFKLPEDYELVSAVYWVYAPGNFSKPVTVEVQHCAYFSNPNQLCFVRTSCTQESLPYKFKVVDGGSFSLDSKYGVLSTTHFSGSGIAKEVTPGEHSCQYCAQVYFEAKHLTKDYFWYCHFVVTKDMEMCITMMKTKYQQEYDIAPPLTFDGDHVALDIDPDGVNTDNGWRIVPLHTAKIMKKQVDSFSSIKNRVPECPLLLQWVHKSRTPNWLEYKVKLLGTGEKGDFFRIFLHPGKFMLGPSSDSTPVVDIHVHTSQSSDPYSPPATQESTVGSEAVPSPSPPPSTAATGSGTAHPRIALSSPPPPTSTAATGSKTADSKTGLDLEAVDGTTVLDEDDLLDVLSAVVDLAERWRKLGISLRLRLGDLKAILTDNPHSCSDCLSEMLTLWLKQNYTVERFGKPTWRRLVEAVEDHVGGNNRALAQRIARDHPGILP